MAQGRMLIKFNNGKEATSTTLTPTSTSLTSTILGCIDLALSMQPNVESVIIEFDGAFKATVTRDENTWDLGVDKNGKTMNAKARKEPDGSWTKI